MTIDMLIYFDKGINSTAKLQDLVLMLFTLIEFVKTM